MRIIGHGIDAVSVSRIARMMADHDDRFLERCFTEAERAHGMTNGVQGRRYAEHIAARFAAKEAAMKALGTGLTSGVSWTDFSVVNDASGRPSLAIAGAAQVVARERGITEWIISLTHTDDLAFASVIATGG
jgi:holo-[acyl-carrier protein] synthase